METELCGSANKTINIKFTDWDEVEKEHKRRWTCAARMNWEIKRWSWRIPPRKSPSPSVTRFDTGCLLMYPRYDTRPSGRDQCSRRWCLVRHVFGKKIKWEAHESRFTHSPGRMIFFCWRLDGEQYFAVLWGFFTVNWSEIYHVGSELRVCVEYCGHRGLLKKCVKFFDAWLSGCSSTQSGHRICFMGDSFVDTESIILWANK